MINIVYKSVYGNEIIKYYLTLEAMATYSAWRFLPLNDYDTFIIKSPYDLYTYKLSFRNMKLMKYNLSEYSKNDEVLLQFQNK